MGILWLCYWPTPVSVWRVEWGQKVREFSVWGPVPVQAFPQPPGRASKWQASPLQPFSCLSFFSAALFQALDLFSFSFLWPVRTRTQHSRTRMHTHPHPPFCSPPNVCRIYRLWCLETQSLSPLLSSFLLLLPAKACCCLIPSRKPPSVMGPGSRPLALLQLLLLQASANSYFHGNQNSFFYPCISTLERKPIIVFFKEKKNWATSGIVNLDCTEFLAPPTPLVSRRPSPTFLHLPPPLPHPVAPDSKAGLRRSLGEFFVSLN